MIPLQKYSYHKRRKKWRNYSKLKETREMRAK